MSKTGVTLGARHPVVSGTPPRTLPEIMAAYERIVIIQALQLNNFSRTHTAVSLGLSRDHLYRRIRLLKINLKEIPCLHGRPRKKGL